MNVAAFQLLFSNNWKKGTELSGATCFRTFEFLTPYPKSVPAYLTLIEPYTWQVWVASVVCIFCLSLFLFIEIKTMSRYVNISSEEHDPFFLMNVTFGILINEAIPNWLLSLKTRKTKQLILLFWIPVACLLGMAYQSNLLSSLVKTGKEKSIDTYQDLIDNGVHLFLRRNTIVKYLLDTHPNDIVKEAHKMTVYHTLDDPVHTQDFKKGKFVFDTILARYIGKRHLARQGKFLGLGPFPCGYYFGINNPVLQKANKLLQMLIDTGVHQRITNKYCSVIDTVLVVQFSFFAKILEF